MVALQASRRGVIGSRLTRKYAFTDHLREMRQKVVKIHYHSLVLVRGRRGRIFRKERKWRQHDFYPLKVDSQLAIIAQRSRETVV